MRTVHLASSLGPTATARYLSSVAPLLGGEQLVINLGESRPFADSLRAADTRVEEISFRGPFDLAAAVRLRNRVREFGPTIVHAWGNRAAATANVLTASPYRKLPFALVVGDLKAGSPLAGPLVARTRRLATARRDSSPIVAVGPVEPVAHSSLGLPDGARFILNAGGFDERSDQRVAVWSFDMLRYVDPTAHLVVIGDGPLRQKVEQFARSISRGDIRIHFLGVRADVPALLASAAIAFVSHREGGKTFAAEALVAGTPLVAIDTADARATIRDGENGLLVKRGDYPGQAGALRRILSSAELAERLRAGARRTRVPAPAEAAAELLAFYRAHAG